MKRRVRDDSHLTMYSRPGVENSMNADGNASVTTTATTTITDFTKDESIKMNRTPPSYGTAESMGSVSNSVSLDTYFHDAREVYENETPVHISSSTQKPFIQEIIPFHEVPSTSRRRRSHHHSPLDAFQPKTTVPTSRYSSPNDNSMVSSPMNAGTSCHTILSNPLFMTGSPTGLCKSLTDMESLCRNAEVLAETLNNLCHAITSNTQQHQHLCQQQQQQQIQHEESHRHHRSRSRHNSHRITEVDGELEGTSRKRHSPSKFSHSQQRRTNSSRHSGGVASSSSMKKTSPVKDVLKQSNQQRKLKSPQERILFPPLYSDDEQEGAYSPTNDLPLIDDRSWKRTDRVIVELRMVFLKIGEIDTLKEVYHAEIFTQAKWREPKLDHRTPEELLNVDLQPFWNPLLSIDNILTESKEQHWLTAVSNEKGEAFLVERRKIKGVFMETLELNDFPLDVQDLTVTMTSERPDTELDLVPDSVEQSGINLKTFVDQQEWKLHEHIEITKRSVAQEYSTSMKSHPFLSVTCRASRRPGYFYWNVFLIMFFITSLSFATFSLPPEKPENRLQLSFTLFLTSVAFKFVINQSLPKISYLTYMDKYVLMSLAILCAISVWHATVTLIPVNIPPLKPLNTSNSSSPLSNSTLSYRIPQNDSSAVETTLSALQMIFPTATMISPILFQNQSTQSTQSSSTQAATTLQSQKTSTSSSTTRKGRIKRLLENKANFLRKLERDFFTSFIILYILAHLIFGFWLYFDACKRRREMKEKDRQYKKEIRCTDV